MSTEAALRTNHILRIAFGAPAAFLLSNSFGTPLAYIAGSAYVTLAATMPARPPFKAVAVLTAVVWLFPALLGTLLGALVPYPYMLVSFIGLALFVGFRLQAAPATKPLGAILVLVAVVMPVIQDIARDYAGALGSVLTLTIGLNLTCALAVLLLAFAALPGRAAGVRPAPAPIDGAAATRLAAINAAILVPVVIVLLSLDLSSAMRVLLVAATVLAAMSETDQRREIHSALLGLAIAGGAALLVSSVASLWPVTAPAMLLIALFGLLLGARAIEPVGGPAVTAGLSTLWALLGVGGDDPLGQTAWWLFLAACGILYAVAARRLLRVARPSRGLPVPAGA